MQFPIYLDYSSTTPVDPRVADKMMECLTLEGNYGNPASRSHSVGWKAEEAVETARRQVADLLRCDPREIVWTSGATEADNLAIKGVAHFYEKKGRHIVTSKIEHKAVLDSCRQLEREGYEVTYLDPDEKGIISPELVASAIRPDTILVTLMHVNNEIGVVNDIESIGKITREKGVIFHVDAAQSPGKLEIDMETKHHDHLRKPHYILLNGKNLQSLVEKSLNLRLHYLYRLIELAYEMYYQIDRCSQNLFRFFHRLCVTGNYFSNRKVHHIVY